MSADRRGFLKQAGLSAAGVAFSSGPFIGRVRGAGERIVSGFIGCGGQGRWNLRDFRRVSDVDVVAVCDVYAANLNDAVEMTGGKATAYADFRRLLDRKDIDAVVISTPDHWHALQTIMACQAGKDVYVEKPLSLTIAEGRAMVEAARRTKRVVQVGTQQRSGAHFQKAAQIVRSGALGKVTFVRTWRYGVGGSAMYPEGIGKPPDTDPLPGLDWDMWLGPAPYVPYNRNRCLYNFRWFWDYSGGMLTDWGVHLLDVVHWAMDVDAPLTAYATGGKYFMADNRETPDNLEVVYEYPGFIATFSHRMLNSTIDGRGYGIQFEGTQGTLFVDRGGYELKPERRRVGDETDVPAEKPSKGEATAQHLPHVRNFIECVKSRKAPASDVETGHRSTSACLIGNIAYRAKRKVSWDAKAERVTDVSEVNALLSKEYRKPWALPSPV